jgi:glycosyltransferase involved in cell wall biosynthesis
MARIPNSCLVCAFPARSGLGRSAANLFRLGFFEQMLFLKFHRTDSEAGYPRVVQSRWNRLGGAGAYASQFLPSAWREALRPFEYVHFQSPHFFHLATAVRQATGTIHDILFFDARQRHGYPMGARGYFRNEFRHANRLAGITADSEQGRMEVTGIAPTLHPTVLHLWTDPSFTARDRSEARKQLGLPEDRVILLNVSADGPRKNLEILPRMLNDLGKDYLLVRIGPSRRILSEFHQGNFQPFESVSDARYPLFFNAADMVVQPSREEGFGYPVIEAINSGTPVLASAIPIFRELLGADYPYFLDPDSPEDWVRTARSVGSSLTSPGVVSGLYQRIGSYYQEERGARDFEAFLRQSGIL